MRGRVRTRAWWRAVGLAAGLVGLLATSAYAEEQPAPLTTSAVAVQEENPVRDTEAEAAVAAVALNQPVEVLAYRSEYRDVFAQPDGSLIANDHTQPVRVIQNGEWVPTDATLVPGPSGTIVPTAAMIDMRFSAGGSTPLVVVDRDGKTLSLQWPWTLPTPVLNGDQATYPNVFPDVDLVLNTTIEGFSHIIVIKTPEAGDIPELQNLQLGVSASGLTVEETEDGGVVALDPATGNPVIETGAPTMWDDGDTPGEGQRSADTQADGDDPTVGPSESAKVAPVGLELTGDTLTLTPDRAMLDDPGTNWPVYVDPVWQATSNSAWAMVDSGYPSEEYWKFDGKRHERIGLCPESCNSSKVKRLFYTLATPYAGKTIMSAEFRVTMQHAWNSTPQAAALYLMPAGIKSSTNWSNQPGGSGWSGANHLESKSPTSTQSSCTSTNQNASWNAKEAVQLAVTNKWSNITLGIKAVNEGNSQHSKRFCDNAVLSVRYNRAPQIAAVADLTMSPGGQCVFGASRPYTDVPPMLNAVLRDPDHSSAHAEQIKAEFKVTWTPSGGTLQTRGFTTALKSSGSVFQYKVPAEIPQNVVISWEVRASDNTSWGPWSSDGTRNPCEFTYDASSPAPPDIDSAIYLPEDAADNGTPDAPSCNNNSDLWQGSIGVYGTFTFDSAATDVYAYRFGFNTNPNPDQATWLRPTTDGGPVSMQWLPDKEGPRTVNVQAVDRAGRSSSIASCTFRVGKTPPISQWPLFDVSGDPNADDQFGGNAATAGSGATFGVAGPGGPSDTAVRLDGTPNGFLATDANVLRDTGKSFVVTAWVKTTDVNRRQTAISQDGTGESGFSLGVENGSWVFRLPVSDVNSLGEWKVSVAGATTGWTYLTALYDAAQRTISLQVGDGTPVTAERRSVTKSRGGIQLGRRLTKSGYTDHWQGELADVSLFDRLIQGQEVTGLKKTAPTRAAYWQTNTATGVTSPEYGGGAQLTLGAEASVYRHPALALLGGGHLALTGKPASYASTTVNADTAGSFTVAARVKLSSDCQGTPMTVFSQKGAHDSAFVLRCNTLGNWELAVPGADVVGGESTVVDTGERPKTLGKGDHLALVYNGYTREMLLYVNGVPTDAIELITPFVATGGLQIGRAFVDDSFREGLSGAVDDVRVYSGVADSTLVQRIGFPTRETPAL
ncbi:LamG-like jellyroll fold domain-containing protein [Micromonospora sp. NPDC050397]|uniref:LamG domain-containing protein n=1 Tax=Micromonospora sp. NPDC050397 TaxID=3364279 RepID=UPI00384AF31D